MAGLDRIEPGASVEVHGPAEEWSAVYVDGRLASVGDTYDQYENLLRRLGVRFVDGEDFMRGQDQQKGVAQTIAQVDAYRLARLEARVKADQLREQAQALLAEADALDLTHR